MVQNKLQELVNESRKYREKELTLAAATADFMESYENCGFEMKPIEKITAKALWDEKELPMCHLLRRKIQGVFGTDDYRYYYIFFIKEWNKYWCTEGQADRSSKRGKLGVTMLFDPMVDMILDKRRSAVACFVIVTPDKFYYMKLDDMIKYYNVHGIFVNEKFKREFIGIEKDKMLESDPLL